jgi:hypothetical protein
MAATIGPDGAASGGGFSGAAGGVGAVLGAISDFPVPEAGENSILRTGNAKTRREIRPSE